MVKGVKNPIGSNILAVNLRTDLFVSGSALPYLYSSEKSKSNSSVTVLYVTPKTFTNSCDDSTFPAVVATLAYDSSSFLVSVVFDFDPSRSRSRFLIAVNSYFELEFHFRRLNPVRVVFVHLIFIQYIKIENENQYSVRLPFI